MGVTWYPRLDSFPVGRDRILGYVVGTTCIPPAIPLSAQLPQNGPRRQGFVSPRNNGAPSTPAGHSEKDLPPREEMAQDKWSSRP
jgi:hypothetical protein